MNQRILLSGLASLWLSWPVMAQEEPAPPPPIPPVDAPEAPAPDKDVPIPPKVQDEQVEPTVDIRRDEDDNLIEEYRLDGQVYMVKVTPKHGIPYYYMDDDGDGRLELQERDHATSPVRPVYWKVKEWN